MRKRLMVLTLTLALGATAAAVALGAEGPGDAGMVRSGNQLAGTWRVTVNRPAPQPAITSLQVYTADGSVIEAANDGNARSAGYGSWERVNGRTYAASSTFFRFDPATGAPVGSTKLDRTIELSPDGQTIGVITHVVVYDVNGNVIGDVRVPATGERYPVDRIPAQS
jgi:hypothetical protein